MDFNAIAARLRQLDEAPVPAIPGAPAEMPDPKPSININMNAQGANGIQDLLKILADIDSREEPTKLDIDMDGDHQPDVAVLDEPEMTMDDIDEGTTKDMESKILDWYKKYETNIGNNGDTLPEGYLEYMMSSGIFSDAYDQDETAKAEKMIGKPYTEWDYDDQEKALEMMPITKAMFDEIKQITGTQGEEAAEMVDDVINNMKEAYANEPDEEIEDINYLVNKLAGGMNRPKGTHTKVSSADNPLQKVSAGESIETQKTDLRSQIRAELAQKLSEMKGE